MRKIKFKVWDSTKGKMLTNATDIYLATNDGGVFEIEPKKSGLKIVQFTGLLDKNGKEIWEGDIVQSFFNNKPHRRHEIKYIERSFCMSNEPDDTEMDCVWYHNIEIIGNIFV